MRAIVLILFVLDRPWEILFDPHLRSGTLIQNTNYNFSIRSFPSENMLDTDLRDIGQENDTIFKIVKKKTLFCESDVVLISLTYQMNSSLGVGFLGLVGVLENDPAKAAVERKTSAREKIAMPKLGVRARSPEKFL